MKNNPVAKNAHKFNKAQVHKDKKKAMKKGDRKHKGSYESVDEVLKVSDGVSAWIKDFQSSDAPQFAGKSAEKRKEMALAAYLDAKNGDKKEMKEKSKGLWHNIHQKRKRGEPPAKPGDKDYPKTLDIESKNTPGDGNPCWDTHKKVGTKMKNGKRVNDCVPKNEATAQDRLDRMAAKHGLGKPNKAADDYLAKMMKKYGAKDMADLKKKMGMKEGKKVECPECEGKGCDHCDDKGYHMKESMDPRDFTDKAGYLVVVKNRKGDEEIKQFFNTKPAAQKYAKRVQKGPDKAMIYKTDGRKMMKEDLQELTQKDLEAIMNRKQANLVRTGRAKPEPKQKDTSRGRGTDTEDDHSIVMQLRKAQDMKGKYDIKVGPGKSTRIPAQVIDSLLNTYDRLRTPADKKKFATMATHELRKRAGVKDKPAPTASDKAMDKFNKSRARGIPAPRGRSSGPTDKELRDIERGK